MKDKLNFPRRYFLNLKEISYSKTYFFKKKPSRAIWIPPGDCCHCSYRPAVYQPDSEVESESVGSQETVISKMNSGKIKWPLSHNRLVWFSTLVNIRPPLRIQICKPVSWSEFHIKISGDFSVKISQDVGKTYIKTYFLDSNF